MAVTDLQVCQKDGTRLLMRNTYPPPIFRCGAGHKTTLGASYCPCRYEKPLIFMYFMVY